MEPFFPCNILVIRKERNVQSFLRINLHEVLCGVMGFYSFLFQDFHVSTIIWGWNKVGFSSHKLNCRGLLCQRLFELNSDGSVVGNLRAAGVGRIICDGEGVTIYLLQVPLVFVLLITWNWLLWELVSTR